MNTDERQADEVSERRLWRDMYEALDNKLDRLLEGNSLLAERLEFLEERFEVLAKKFDLIEEDIEYKFDIVFDEFITLREELKDCRERE